jgi:23S rRNA (cytosine1962-C5)-methyltransferase
MILTRYTDALILDKPAGCSTHTPDGGLTEGFLEMASRLLETPLWAVHRLDRDTSGCLLVTTNAEAVVAWTEKLALGHKKYVFISPHESKKSVWSVSGRIEKVASHMFGLVSGETNSFTTFAKLGSCPLGFLYEADIKSGKSHQIRIHAQHSGISILGDTQYGGENFSRPMLHARELVLDDKKTASPLPSLFEAAARMQSDYYKFQASTDRRRFLLSLESETTNAFRLAHREWSRDRSPKLCVEKLGDVLQFLNYTSNTLDAEFIEYCVQATKSHHWFVRQMVNRGKTGGDENISQVSPHLPIQWQILENKMKFDMRHHHGLSTGLFLDQRENRKRLLKHAQGKRVANFFSYTCGFSVAAALGGAHEVASIDTSSVTIEWGKNNFKLNNLDPEKYEFFVADSIFFLKSCLKRKRQFDVVILDPPTFSRHKHGTFKITEDLNMLLELAFSSLAPQGVMLITTNDENLSTEKLSLAIETVAETTLKKAIRLERVVPPYDFEFPLERDTVMKGFWVYI